jgi:hypothetical protein
MRYILAIGLALGLGAAEIQAQTSIPLHIRGSNAFGTIDLPGGVHADLTLSFEQVTNLTPTALAASARLVDPRDPALAARLPPGGLITIPEAFPVLLRISPTRSSTLAFGGLVHVSLHTPNLHLDPDTPLALFRAPDGGRFQDIAAWEASGSYRVCGSGGSFSEFLIVVDRRPPRSPALTKLDALDGSVAAYADSMTPPVVAVLRQLLAEIRSLNDAGSLVAAEDKARELDRYVRAHSGREIPNVWRANEPGRVNVAGILRSQAKTLKFSLQRDEDEQ